MGFMICVLIVILYPITKHFIFMAWTMTIGRGTSERVGDEIESEYAKNFFYNDTPPRYDNLENCEEFE